MEKITSDIITICLIGSGLLFGCFLIGRRFSPWYAEEQRVTKPITEYDLLVKKINRASSGRELGKIEDSIIQFREKYRKERAGRVLSSDLYVALYNRYEAIDHFKKSTANDNV